MLLRLEGDEMVAARLAADPDQLLVERAETVDQALEQLGLGLPHRRRKLRIGMDEPRQMAGEQAAQVPGEGSVGIQFQQPGMDVVETEENGVDRRQRPARKLGAALEQPLLRLTGQRRSSALEILPRDSDWDGQNSAAPIAITVATPAVASPAVPTGATARP